MNTEVPKSPETVRKVAALQGLALAALNVIALIASISVETLGALNLLAAAVIVVVDAFWLRDRVTPIDGLHERLSALSDEG